MTVWLTAASTRPGFSAGAPKPGTDKGSGAFIWISREQPERKTRLRHDIEATDHQIDQLVYELYGLTEDEIKIVEEAVAK